MLTTNASLATTVLAALGSLLIARALGPAGRGDWAVISALALLIGTVGTLGVPTAVSYGLAQLPYARRAMYLRAALCAALLLAMLAGTACTAVALMLTLGDAPTLVLALSGCISAAVVMHQIVQHAVLTGGTLRWYAAAQIAPPALTLLALGMLAASGSLSVLAVTAVSALSGASGAAVALRGLQRAGLLRRRPLWLPLREVVTTLRPDLTYAVTTFATISLSQVVHRVDVLLVSGYKGSTAAGLYAVAVQVADLLMVVPAALGMVLFRRAATSVSGHWGDALRTLAWTAPIAAAAALLVGVAAGSLIEGFFGAEFAGAVAPLRWLLPGVVLLGLQSLVSSYLAGRGRPRAVLYAWTIAAAFTIVADLIVVPVHGIEGAAIVSSVSYLLVLGLHVKPLLDIRRHDLVGAPR